VWGFGALLICLLGTGLRAWPLVESDIRVVAPIAASTHELGRLLAWDQRYAIWAIRRNSETLLRSPLRLFDAEGCYPAPRSLARGHAVVTLGILAVPLRAFVSDPIALHNAVWMLVMLASGLVMYALVSDWTGSPAAGVLAAAVYAFHPAKISAPQHFYLTDTMWLVLALMLFGRILRSPRWYAGVGLGLAVALQLGAGVYPALGAAAVGGVFVVSAVAGRSVPLRAIFPLLVAVSICVVAAVVLYTPYVEFERLGIYFPRARYFLSPRSLAPGGVFFLGWAPVTLLLLGLLPVAGSGPSGAPLRGTRAALVAAAVIVLWIATGGHLFGSFAAAIPQASDLAGGAGVTDQAPTALYDRTVGWLPGLRTGRAPAYAHGAADVCLSILVGFGAATLAGVRWRRAGDLALVAIATSLALDLGLLPTVRFDPVVQRPPEEDLAFFQALSAAGDRGPILELPLVSDLAWWSRDSASILASAYHGRRTSACFSSFPHTHLEAIRGSIENIPELHALDTVRAAGFRTLLIHLGPDSPAGPRLLKRLESAAAIGSAPLRLTRRNERMAAFALLSPSGDSAR
jgi:hypothetical protein